MLPSESWKYGIIKIVHPTVDHDENFCELVELYSHLDPESEARVFHSFCKARINSMEELSSAYNDAMKDGVNTWFAENGTFSVSEHGFWDWEPTLNSEDLSAYEEEMELYKVYGGD